MDEAVMRIGFWLVGGVSQTKESERRGRRPGHPGAVHSGTPLPAPVYLSKSHEIHFLWQGWWRQQCLQPDATIF